MTHSPLRTHTITTLHLPRLLTLAPQTPTPHPHSVPHLPPFQNITTSSSPTALSQPSSTSSPQPVATPSPPPPPSPSGSTPPNHQTHPHLLHLLCRPLLILHHPNLPPSLPLLPFHPKPPSILPPSHPNPPTPPHRPPRPGFRSSRIRGLRDDVFKTRGCFETFKISSSCRSTRRRAWVITGLVDGHGRDRNSCYIDTSSVTTSLDGLDAPLQQQPVVTYRRLLHLYHRILLQRYPLILFGHQRG
ncbi:hypothetical protein BC829DRAFT_287453 [Chytridium lagenaria]|nr:hypothetical protein BC829DRAFT_287453 [Chytridium lagenaria]